MVSPIPAMPEQAFDKVNTAQAAHNLRAPGDHSGVDGSAGSSGIAAAKAA